MTASSSFTSGVHIQRGLVIPLADGTRLSGDLYRPAGLASGPVLVSYYPYRADDIIGSLFEQTRIGLCRRGYATLFADMTGTGASEGGYAESFDLPREGRDCAEIIEWAAGQEWCDGSVGAWGVSYGGMNALAAAACRPPHLRGIVAVYATTDMYQDTIAPGGCAAMLGRYAWAAHMLALGLCPPTRQDPGGRWERTWRQRLQRLETTPPHALNWQAHPERDDYWQARVVDAAAVEVPAMLIGGWADAYSDAMIRAFGQVGGAKRLIMGPWMHVLPHLSTVEPYDWVTAMADWWDAHLSRDRAAADPEPEPPVLYFSHGGGWRAAQQWPPAGVSARRFFPAGHRLETAPPAEPAEPHLPRRPAGRAGRGNLGPVRHRQRLARGAKRRRRAEPRLHQRSAARAHADRGQPRGRPVRQPASGRRDEPGGAGVGGRPRRAVGAHHLRQAPPPARRS